MNPKISSNTIHNQDSPNLPTMKAAFCITSPAHFFTTCKNSSPFAVPLLKPRISPPSRISLVKATPVSNDASTVDYSSMTSVFPAEACETVGGDACLADMYPEVKLNPEARSSTQGTVASEEEVDREYLEYNDAKTVFRGEACDDLGGEFCGHEYQKGVY